VRIFSDIFRKFIKPEKTIFIVEDNALYAKSLLSFLHLRFPSVRIRVFPVGEDCLLELDLKPHLIIMDHLLNTNFNDAATGLSTIGKIKKKMANANIILLSVQAELDVFVRTLAEFGCIYLKKDADTFRKLEQCMNEMDLH
jgi:ActR/RegA family two-component response regulator